MKPLRPVLFGPNGKPLASHLYPSLRTAPHQYRPRRRIPFDTRQNFSAYDREESVNLSRQLFAQLSNLGSAIREKNQWAFGDAWDPHYTGPREAWGEEATAWLRDQFYPNCDRLGRYDYTTNLYLSGIAWDRDGDDLMVLTEDENGSGFPKLQWIPGYRICNGREDKDTVADGPFKGYLIYDGVVFDASDKAVAVRVPGVDEEGKETVATYSIGYGGNADFAYQPEWQDHGRGIPLVARCSLDWVDLDDIDQFLKRGVKRACEIGLLNKTKDGEPQGGNEIPQEVETIDANGNTKVVYEDVDLEGGGMYYLSAPDGEDISGLNYQNPHPNVEAFIQRIERRGIKAVGWAYELIYLSESGRAATRLVCDLGNQSIWQQQKLGLRRTWRALRYALAKAMKNGFISRNPDPKDAYFNWDFGLPKPLSVDAGNDEQADRENLKMGTTCKAIIAAKRGYHHRDIERQRKKEIITQAKDATEIETATSGKISFDKAFELLEQRAANPTAQAAQPETAEPKES